jgi:hypothetical protein
MKRLVTFFRRMLGGPYRSSLLKPKNAVNYIGAFEKMLVGEARLHGAEDVICWLIHHTTIAAAHATINGWQRQSDRKIIAISKIISRTTASSRRNARLVSMMSVSALAVSEITVSFRSNASTLSFNSYSSPASHTASPARAFPKEHRIFRRRLHGRTRLLNQKCVSYKLQDFSSAPWPLSMCCQFLCK